MSSLSCWSGLGGRVHAGSSRRSESQVLEPEDELVPITYRAKSPDSITDAPMVLRLHSSSLLSWDPFDQSGSRGLTSSSDGIEGHVLL
jgi:hypothetical protein